MKFHWLFIFFLFLSCKEDEFRFAQNDDLVCFVNPEIAPQFPGVMLALHKFIESKLSVPNQYNYGRIFIQFIVEKDGRVSNVEVLKGINNSFDEEALKIVKSFPSFLPGRLNGHPIRIRMILPIRFNS